MKISRQTKIYELIKKHEIENQIELTKMLSEAGFNVTQSTVSRDIRELGLIRTATFHGTYRYSAPPSNRVPDMDRLNRVFKDGFVSMDCAGNLLVIRTFNGMAMAVASAVDAMRFPGILGTVAGDDVVMCVAKTPEEAAALMEKIK